jgi:ABC-2 type transport system permease protein
MNTLTHAPQKEIMAWQRVLRAYWIETKYEFLRFIRMPGYAIPTMLMPVFLYVLIGILVVGPQAVLDDPKLPAYLFSAFLVFAVTSPGMYGLGQAFAAERQSGLLTLKRTQPMPPIAYLIAKMLSILIFTTVTIGILITLATSFGHLTLDGMQMLRIFTAGLLGMTAFCAMGLFIGSLVSGTAAPAIVNVLYFPMMYLSGTFFPLSETLAPWAMIWPTFYLDQIFFAITLGESAISESMCTVVLIGLTLLFAGLASRRLATAS